MKNVSIKQEGKLLKITIDLSKNFGPSQSGKTDIIATTSGNRQLMGFEDQGVFLGLTLYQWNDNIPLFELLEHRIKKIKRVPLLDKGKDNG